MKRVARIEGLVELREVMGFGDGGEKWLWCAGMSSNSFMHKLRGIGLCSKCTHRLLNNIEQRNKYDRLIIEALMNHLEG